MIDLCENRPMEVRAKARRRGGAAAAAFLMAPARGACARESACARGYMAHVRANQNMRRKNVMRARTHPGAGGV